VNPTLSQTENGESNEGTLGALLYADKLKVRVSEEEWVALVHRIANRDQAALAELYARTHRPVFTLTLRITNDPRIAEELTVDVFQDVWRRAHDYDPVGGTVLGWVMNQARSRAIDRLRFERRKKRVNPDPSGAQAAEFEVDTATQALFREQGQLLRAALAVLTTEERTAIEAAFFDELSYADAAARLGHPLGTIKTRIRSGLAKLRRALLDGERTA
jgi:RNA polymerase sigma-70 factor (ECF subfamily)